MHVAAVGELNRLRTFGLQRVLIYLSVSGAISATFFVWSTVASPGAYVLWYLSQALVAGLAAIILALALSRAMSDPGSYLALVRVATAATLVTAGLLLLEALHIISIAARAVILGGNQGLDWVWGLSYLVLFGIQWFMTTDAAFSLFRCLRRNKHPDEPY